jgi:hypothetical protein
MRFKADFASLIAASALMLLDIAAFGQQAKIAPLPVRPSTFLNDFRTYVATNPKGSAVEKVEAANTILDKTGLDFVLFLDDATCQKVEEARRQSKDPLAPVHLSGTLRSVNADGANLALPDVQPASASCGCHFAIPLLQFNNTEFITKILGRNIAFYVPRSVTPNFAFLVDPGDHALVKRRWAIPDRLTPIGVSFDENVLFLGFREPELGDLALAVFGEGVFQIVSREEAENGGKGVAIKKSPTDERELISFDRWKKTFVVAFRPPCSR